MIFNVPIFNDVAYPMDDVRVTAHILRDRSLSCRITQMGFCNLLVVRLGHSRTVYTICMATANDGAIAARHVSSRYSLV